MSPKLNNSEKKCLEAFLNSVGDTNPSPVFSHLSSGAVSILGLILFTEWKSMNVSTLIVGTLLICLGGVLVAKA